MALSPYDLTRLETEPIEVVFQTRGKVHEAELETLNVGGEVIRLERLSDIQGLYSCTGANCSFIDCGCSPSCGC